MESWILKGVKINSVSEQVIQFQIMFFKFNIVIKIQLLEAQISVHTNSLLSMFSDKKSQMDLET